MCRAAASFHISRKFRSECSAPYLFRKFSEFSKMMGGRSLSFRNFRKVQNLPLNYRKLQNKVQKIEVKFRNFSTIYRAADILRKFLQGIKKNHHYLFYNITSVIPAAVEYFPLVLSMKIFTAGLNIKPQLLFFLLIPSYFLFPLHFLFLFHFFCKHE